MQYTDTLIPLKIADTKASKDKKTEYKTIILYDPENDKEVRTYVVSSYRNYKKWKKVIDYNLNSGTAILKGNIKYKEDAIINADSKFTMYPGASWNDVADIIKNRRNTSLV